MREPKILKVFKGALDTMKFVSDTSFKNEDYVEFVTKEDYDYLLKCYRNMVDLKDSYKSEAESLYVDSIKTAGRVNIIYNDSLNTYQINKWNDEGYRIVSCVPTRVQAGAQLYEVVLTKEK